MPRFSERSKQRLSTCRQELQDLFSEVIKEFDCTIICGHRAEPEQTEAFKAGFSKAEWPNGKHNSKPSNAVDVLPCPIIYADTDRMYYFAGYVRGVASKMGIKIRWGGNWDGDTEVRDQTFNDLGHFEVAV